MALGWDFLASQFPNSEGKIPNPRDWDLRINHRGIFVGENEKSLNQENSRKSRKSDKKN